MNAQRIEQMATTGPGEELHVVPAHDDIVGMDTNAIFEIYVLRPITTVGKNTSCHMGGRNRVLRRDLVAN